MALRVQSEHIKTLMSENQYHLSDMQINNKLDA